MGRRSGKERASVRSCNSWLTSSASVGRININTQCGRSPDELPFSARRSSALGTMSVSEALRAFSTETLVAAKDGELNGAVTQALAAQSKFMAPLTEGSDPREL